MKRVLAASLGFLIMASLLVTNTYAAREKFGVDERHKSAEKVNFQTVHRKNPLENGHAMV